MTKEEKQKGYDQELAMRRKIRLQKVEDSKIPPVGIPFTDLLVEKEPVWGESKKLGKYYQTAVYKLNTQLIYPSQLVVVEFPTNYHANPFNYNAKGNGKYNLRGSAVVLEVSTGGLHLLLCSPCYPHDGHTSLKNILCLSAEDIYENENIKLWNHPFLRSTTINPKTGEPLGDSM